MRTTHCNRIAAVIAVPAMQCRKKSPCLQDSYITSTKTESPYHVLDTKARHQQKHNKVGRDWYAKVAAVKSCPLI